jgi:hypothetical protein
LDDLIGVANLAVVKCINLFVGEEENFLPYLLKSLKHELWRYYENQVTRDTKLNVPLNEDIAEIIDTSQEEGIVRLLEIQKTIQTLSKVELHLLKLTLEGKNLRQCSEIMTEKYGKGENKKGFKIRAITLMRQRLVEKLFSGLEEEDES